MPDIEKAKEKLLKYLLSGPGFQAVHISSLCGPWGCDFEDLKAATILLSENRCVELRKWHDSRRFVRLTDENERWFFYHSNFEARLMPRGRELIGQIEEKARKPPPAPGPAVTVQRIHFEDFDGHQFERLVFGYLLRSDSWQMLEWYGQVGTDLGRDIWGVTEDGKAVCVQCANRRDVPFEKVASDISKAVSGPKGCPQKFVLIAGGSLSAQLRDRVRDHAKKSGISSCELWSGPEFEERLRVGAPELLKRFVEGIAFPEDRAEIAKIASQTTPLRDDQILALMARLFDRPAFHTPFHRESSIPAFKKAITDTIEALNTGIHRLRDGTEIRRIPSRHDVQDSAARMALADIERRLCDLRSAYDGFLRSGDVKPCNCKNEDCPTFMVSDRAAETMDRLRREILSFFEAIASSSKRRGSIYSGD